MSKSNAFKHVKEHNHKGKSKTMIAKGREFGGRGNIQHWASVADILVEEETFLPPPRFFWLV